ncbi:AfsA-related hotdog domain-containing protein [Streptomyces sp. NPDC047085]|uniref:AfsA-related hotdog domain-containing protein n=1 Tax=Streptomyces sp. NPDC047085 TaxID=3155140 RepID=UPI00340228C2
MDTLPAPSSSFLGPFHLVHKPDNPETFLLDAGAPSRQHFVFAAELADEHVLFGATSASHHDLLVPVEALRQAAMFAARRYFRVPEKRLTVVAAAGTEITDVAPWRRTGQVSQIALELSLTPTDVVLGVPRGLTCKAAVSIDGRRCGSADARLVFLTPGIYRGHRETGRRQSEESLARGLGDVDSPGMPEPARVGHRDGRHVLVGLPVEDGDEALLFPVNAAAAREVLPGEPDELPAILFLEASRQAALIAAAELHGFAPGRTLLTRWGASFRGFAEPGLPLFCTVRGAGADGGQTGAARDAAGRPRAELRLAFLQGEREVADVSVSVLQDC